MSSSAATVRRLCPLDRDPEPGKVTDYSPADADRLADDVLRVSSNGSFVSRILRVITRSGRSKHFEMLTGQDGLTFGITDFAAGSVSSFFRAAASGFPDDFARAFGPKAPLLTDSKWVEENNGGHHEWDNRGLIRHRWLREGLAELLAAEHLRGLQLSRFVEGKVTPSHRALVAAGLTAEWTLAVMVGIANSFGAGGMRDGFLRRAVEKADAQHLTGAARERFIAEDMASRYIGRDVKDEPNARKVLEAIRNPAAPIPERDSGLGHRGRRVWETLRAFPDRARPPTELGAFALAPGELWAQDATTAVAAPPAP